MSPTFHVWLRMELLYLSSSLNSRAQEEHHVAVDNYESLIHPYLLLPHVLMMEHQPAPFLHASLTLT